MNPAPFFSALPSLLNPKPLICECVAVRFCLALSLTSVICTPDAMVVGANGRDGGEAVIEVLFGQKAKREIRARERWVVPCGLGRVEVVEVGWWWLCRARFEVGWKIEVDALELRDGRTAGTGVRSNST
jgi:hypothetical protein